MKRNPFKPFFVVALVALSVALGIWYSSKHPEVLKELTHTPQLVLILLIFLYVVFTCSLALVLKGSLLFAKARIPTKESFLVTAYSAIINFFGPLQSGPAFRALYLKRKHKVAIKDYAAATLIYYAAYSGLSVLLLLAPVPFFLSYIIGGALLASLGIYIFRNSAKIKQIRTGDYKGVVTIVGATALQVVLLVIIFGVELRATGTHIPLVQLLAYTGAANLALFVSITPGAIGFRESFLYFSRQLHGVEPSAIVAANILDRSVYVFMLGLLAVSIFATHAGDNFRKTIK